LNSGTLNVPLPGPLRLKVPASSFFLRAGGFFLVAAKHASFGVAERALRRRSWGQLK